MIITISRQTPYIPAPYMGGGGDIGRQPYQMQHGTGGRKPVEITCAWSFYNTPKFNCPTTVPLAAGRETFALGRCNRPRSFRNSAAAFDLNGSIKIKTPSDHEIIITRTNKENTSVARAYVDLKELKYQVKLDEQVFIF